MPPIPRLKFISQRRAAGCLGKGEPKLLGRKIGTLAAGVIAAAALMVGTTPSASAEVSSGTNTTAACGISVSKWFTKGITRYVEVKNTCTTSKTFCVDMPNWPDTGPYTISGADLYKTFGYAGAGALRGRGIYTTSSDCGPV
jgi:hypothetical protein